MTVKPSDMTPMVVLTEGEGAGPVRHSRPIYVDLLPPCNHACPAGENIQAWLDLAQAGKYREAWETLVRDNPMPAVHGRVCYHPCEGCCNRGELDAPVSIHAVERFLGDLATKRSWPFQGRASAKRQTSAGDRRRPERIIGRISPRAPGTRCRDPRSGPAAGRHDAFRHPGLPTAARSLDGGNRAHRGHGRRRSL